MFLKLHHYGIPIFVNMSKVYDFHEESSGTRLHFDTTVAPYGGYGLYNTKRPRNLCHWSQDVDESPEVILKALTGISK